MTQQVLVTKKQVEDAFLKGGYTINERFEECGYLYFPTCAPFTKENPEQGRVFWSVDRYEYPDTEEGLMERNLDEAFGQIRDSVSISASWGFPSEKQRREMAELLRLYVLYMREARGKVSERVLNARRRRNRVQDEED